MKEAEDKKHKHFQYAHIRIPLYKHPGVNLFEIFVPLMILGFINILVFFQENILADKLAIIATATLAFIAFIPTINEAIPNTPEIKLMDILIYMEVLTTILTMIDSLITARTQTINYVFDYTSDGWFWSTVAINLITVIIVVTLFIIHKVWWENVYLDDEHIKKKDTKGSKKLWYNY